jgi:hypothetical protein
MPPNPSDFSARFALSQWRSSPAAVFIVATLATKLGLLWPVVDISFAVTT